MSGRPVPRLAAQYARWLAALFIALQLITAGAALAFILLPLSQRAADDLVGLMVLSAERLLDEAHVEAMAQPGVRRRRHAGPQRDPVRARQFFLEHRPRGRQQLGPGLASR